MKSGRFIIQLKSIEIEERSERNIKDKDRDNISLFCTKLAKLQLEGFICFNK